MLESNSYAFEDQTVFSHKRNFHIIHLLNEMYMYIIRIAYVEEYALVSRHIAISTKKIIGMSILSFQNSL